ncbi:MAG: hypothetical protein HY263_12200 [Chloroflexi bacterium]|nr:hypothetical protein [Chloroflexota bacterium]
MRRIVALVSGLLLTMSLVGPVVAQGGPEINYIVVTSATVDRGGMVTIYGTMWCSQPMDVNIDWGNVNQAVGKTKSVQGGFGGWYWCNGTTPWQTQARADWGKFSSGWAWISGGFSGANWCDEDPNVNPDTYCGPHAKNGFSQYVKIGK